MDNNWILRGSIILGLALLGIGFSNELLLKQKTVTDVEEYEAFVPRKLKRKPASVIDPKSKPSSPYSLFKTAENPEVSVSENTQFNPNESGAGSGIGSDEVADGPVNGDSGGSDGGGSGQGSYAGYSREASRSPSQTSKNNPSNSTTQTQPKTSKTPTQFISGGGGFPISKPTTPVVTTPTPEASGSFEDALGCSASIAGGVFGSSQQIDLSCTAASDISYCVKEGGGCCDPETEGASYTGTFTIGVNPGNFCLSFYGRASSSSKLSSSINHSYVINNNYPDIQMDFPKTQYQTTQYSGVHYLYSNEFGKPNYEVFGMNLSPHDPGPSGLNLSCEDIVNTYTSLATPSAVDMYSPIDLFTLSLSNQLNVPTPFANLDYGDNFLVNVIKNYNFSTELFSCLINKITLFDFDYLNFEVTHGEPELTGSFVPYGFFEESTQVYRGPAGVSVQNDSGQELQSGSISIFY